MSISSLHLNLLLENLLALSPSAKQRFLPFWPTADLFAETLVEYMHRAK
jgi:hypothetical protein